MKSRNRLLLAHAVESALAAGQVLDRFFDRHLTSRIPSRAKYRAGLVTKADEGAQNASIRALEKSPWKMGYLAEESNLLDAPKWRRANAPGRWIIDPLDGTTNFVHGLPLFCVSIAAEWEGELAAGVIYLPRLKELYFGTRGGGSWVRLASGKTMRLKVSQTKTIRESLLTTGFSTDPRIRTSELETFSKLTRLARAVRRPGSAAIDLAWTARGNFDAFWESNLNPWDIAAGCLLVEEAGGRVTDFEGNRLKVEDRTLLATNGLLHHSLMKYT